ncbi:MAG: alpha-amylase [Anaerolineae bacterium]|nr:alpha-amylase [Anaerolineae bacterium]
MRLAYRFTSSFFILLLLTACASSPAPATATVQPSTTTPSPVPPTPTVQPTDTAAPTPIPLPTIPSTPFQPIIGLPQGTDGYPWWNDTVFYEIFVRSFYDSDGDGIGDFNGLTSKLDYLNDGDPNTTTDLGVTGLWLMPIHPSPSYHGYDVTDYYDVNPEYGTMDDFKLLLDEAHKRGIRVTIDWVLNHTSIQHSWFEQAQDAASPYHEWYRWTADSQPGSGWRYGGAGQYYYALFWEGMPDLNYANPDVVAEMKNVVKFWLQDVGVDGFRLDAAKHIFEDGSVVENTPETHAWYKDLRKFYKSINPQAMTVGEVWSNSDAVSQYLEGDELDLAFDFDLAKNIVFSAGIGDAEYFSDVLRHDITVFPPGQFATFTTNHDQDRAMSVLNDDVDAAKNAAFLLLTSPGVPYLYYGEEIGMLGEKPDEDIRKPLQWSGEANAGFTTGTPWRAPNSDYITKNIDSQTTDPNSLLSVYRALIQLRNSHAALRVGHYHFIETDNKAAYASLRISSEEAVLVLINLSSEPVSDYTLNLEESPLAGDYVIAPLLDPGQFASPTITPQGGFENYQPLPEIPPHGRFILQFQPETK